MSARKTEKERRKRKAMRKALISAGKNRPQIDVGKLLAMLQETTHMNTKLVEETSSVLAEFDRRLNTIEEHLGIKTDSGDSGQRPAEQGEGSDDDESGGGVRLPSVRETGEDIPEVSAQGDGALLDEASAEVPEGA